jgi:tryptophan-rich sensory protein
MDWGLFLTFLVACGAASATGVMFEPGTWYRSLSKPFWTPPGFVFPITWTVLYICMAISAARVAALPDSGQAMAFWAVQIALNTLWTPIFFGLHRVKAALIVMVGLWLSVAATMLAFFALDYWAGVLFVPYLVWVSIAMALNFSVLRMNPQPQPA